MKNLGTGRGAFMRGTGAFWLLEEGCPSWKGFFCFCLSKTHYEPSPFSRRLPDFHGSGLDTTLLASQDGRTRALTLLSLSQPVGRLNGRPDGLTATCATALQATDAVTGTASGSVQRACTIRTETNRNEPRFFRRSISVHFVGGWRKMFSL